MNLARSIFRLYDIRGAYPSEINENVAYAIGLAFAKMNIAKSNENNICLGYDGRLSSPKLYLALSQGLKEAGAKIISIGLCPTPMLYFADAILKPAASIMITGSHNPKGDNGFKMMAKGEPFFGESIQELMTHVAKEDVIKADEVITNEAHLDITTRYLDCAVQGMNINPDLKVAWDPGNGASCDVLKLLLARLPNQNFIINDEIDGNFPNHHPDPTVASNLTQLISLVKNKNCDLGIAFDGDGDRVGFVTHSGKILFGDQMLCLFGRDILSRTQGAKIIVDIKTSQVVFDYLESFGGEVVLSRTGHTFIKSKMRETGAIFAGEMSGHIFFKDSYYGYDDGIYTAMRMLDLLSRQSNSLDKIYDALPLRKSTPEIKIKVPEDKKFILIERIKQQLLVEDIQFIDIDGIRTKGENWWLLRASNTSAALIARCEGATTESLDKVKNELRTILAKYIPIADELEKY